MSCMIEFIGGMTREESVWEVLAVLNSTVLEYMYSVVRLSVVCCRVRIVLEACLNVQTSTHCERAPVSKLNQAKQATEPQAA
jgi:hypothetical protein